MTRNEIRQTAHRWLINFIMTVIVVGRHVKPGFKALMEIGSVPAFGLIGVLAYTATAFELASHHLPWWAVDLTVVGACAISIGSSTWYKRHKNPQLIRMALFDTSRQSEVWNLNVSPEDALFIKRWLEGHKAYQGGDSGV